MSTNHITIIGRLGQDPELKYAASGTAFCNISVADQKAKKLDDGSWENQSATTWFRATVFKEAAEALAETARKGDEVIVTGRVITREWTDKEGQTRSALEIDFAKVGVIPRPRPSQRQQQSAQGDPWATGGQSTQSYSEPPF